MRNARLHLFFSLTAAMVLVGLAAGCASPGPRAGAPLAAEQPVVSVERFLLAANARDFEAMASIFGTARGPVSAQAGSPPACAMRRVGSWIGLARRCVSWQDIELRMSAISEILRHDDYRMASERSVAGRTAPTTRIGVDLHRGTRRYRDVAFVAVRSGSGRWLVEEIDLEAITGAR